MDYIDAVHDLANAIRDVAWDAGRDGPKDPYRLAHRMLRRQSAPAFPNRLQPLYVAVVLTSREYGGPEEGGWWYDVTEIAEVCKAFGWQDARRTHRALSEAHKGAQCRFGRFSCATSTRGTDVDIIVVDDLARLPVEGPFDKPSWE